MKISRKLEWMRPYLNRVKHLVNLKLISNLTAKGQFHLTVSEPYHALIKSSMSNKYEIILLLTYQEKYKYHGKYKCYLRTKPFTKIDLLMHFAHELAHTKHWKHTPERQMLEHQIGTVFMKQLLRDGYISEEDEEKDWKC